MNKVYSLVKVLLKNHLQTTFSTGKRRKEKSNTSTLILIVIISFLMISSFSIPIGFLFKEIGSTFIQVLPSRVFFVLLLPGINLALLIFSTIAIISYFYLSTDISILLPLPLKPYEILLARYIIVVINLYLMVFLFFSPMIVGFLIGINANPLVYIYALIILLILPLIPTAIMAIILTTLMRFSNLSAKKDTFTYIIFFLTITMSIGFSTVSNRLGMMNIDLTQVEKIAQSIDKVLIAFPFLIPAVNSLSLNPLLGFLNLLLYAFVSIGFIYLFLFIASKLYLKGVMGSKEIKSKKKQAKNSREKRQNPVLSYALKEWRILIRTPIYNLNLVAVNFLLIIILTVSLIGIPDLPSFASIVHMTKDLDISSIDTSVVFYVLAGLIFYNGTSMIASTAISRDGKNAIFMKYIPLSPIRQINAKIFFGVMVNLFMPLILLVVVLALGIINVFEFALFMIMYIIFNIFINYGGILIDLARPKLNWDNETVAVKNNWNGALYMFGVSFFGLLIGGFGVLVFFANQFIKASQLKEILILISISGGIGIALLIISLLMLNLVINKVKEILYWVSLMILFTFTSYLALQSLIISIYSLLGYYLNFSINILGWMILIILAITPSLYLLYKGIKDKGSAILESIE